MNKFPTKWMWEAWCILSGIGIWPRYIEPRLLSTTHLSLPIPNLPSKLNGFKILQFSDLHFSSAFPRSLKRKLIRKINEFEPHILVFTGDFLCRSVLEQPEELKDILNSLKASVGYFAVLGNHDYASFVTVNQHGEYDVEDYKSSQSDISKGFGRLFTSVLVNGCITERARQIGFHEELLKLLKETPFKVLHNENQIVSYQECQLNVCGVGEYSLGKLDVEAAFQQYDRDSPGIVLCHHPDGIEILKDQPGDLILCGHTHGGQINLPYLWKRLTRIQHLEYKRGLKKVGKKWVYINRGIASVMPFRWFSIPEITLLTLAKAS